MCAPSNVNDPAKAPDHGFRTSAHGHGLDSAHIYRAPVHHRSIACDLCVTVAVAAKVVVDGRIVSVSFSVTLYDVLDLVGVSAHEGLDRDHFMVIDQGPPA